MKNNKAHRDHAYNYDIPFSQDSKNEEIRGETPKDVFANSIGGQFSYKPGNGKKMTFNKKKQFMKFM